MAKVTRTWDSLSEFIDYAMTPVSEFRGSRMSQSYIGSFHGEKTVADAERIAFNWAEGVARIERIKARVALKSQRTRKQAVAREAGPGVVSMGKFIAGHPQPYVALVDDKRAAKGKGKIVKVLVNLCVSGGISTATIEQRGAAMLALVAALEQSGRRVEIVVGMANAGYTKASHMDYRITVKRASQKLNLNSVAFAVAHPDMFRRFIFSAMEHETGKALEHFGVGGGYGKVTEFREVPADTIYMGGALYGDRQWETDEGTSRWIAEQLARQGVNVK